MARLCDRTGKNVDKWWHPEGGAGDRPGLEGQRPDLSPAQGNALGLAPPDGEALKGCPNFHPSPLVRTSSRPPCSGVPSCITLFTGGVAKPRHRLISCMPPAFELQPPTTSALSAQSADSPVRRPTRPRLGYWGILGDTGVRHLGLPHLGLPQPHPWDGLAHLTNCPIPVFPAVWGKPSTRFKR